MKLIELDALVAKIKRLKNHYDSAAKEFGDEGYKDNVLMEQAKSTVCERVLSFINTLEVKEVDLEKEIDKEWNKCEPIDEGMGLEIASIESEQFDNIAKHFIKLGMCINNPITAEDRGTAEEIIINLKQVEQDYRIDLTKEIEWLRNKVRKGEKV